MNKKVDFYYFKTIANRDFRSSRSNSVAVIDCTDGIYTILYLILLLHDDNSGIVWIFKGAFSFIYPDFPIAFRDNVGDFPSEHHFSFFGGNSDVTFAEGTINDSLKRACNNLTKA